MDDLAAAIEELHDAGVRAHALVSLSRMRGCWLAAARLPDGSLLRERGDAATAARALAAVLSPNGTLALTDDEPLVLISLDRIAPRGVSASGSSSVSLCRWTS